MQRCIYYADGRLVIVVGGGRGLYEVGFSLIRVRLPVEFGCAVGHANVERILCNLCCSKERVRESNVNALD